MDKTPLSDRRPLASRILIAIHLLLGLGALFGGGALILDPTGDLIRMPLSLLGPTPFHSFLIPGLILFIFLGIFPLVVAYGLVTRPPSRTAGLLNLFPQRHWAWSYSLYTGFVLIGWITIQVYLIEGIGLIHVVYVFWGLLIQGVTLLPVVQEDYLVE